MPCRRKVLDIEKENDFYLRAAFSAGLARTCPAGGGAGVEKALSSASDAEVLFNISPVYIITWHINCVIVNDAKGCGKKCSKLNIAPEH